MTQMSPHEIVTIDEDESMTTSSGPNSPRTTGSPRNGRVLYCRKCEGHGEKVILKNHAPSCPYILCTCRSCERLNQKRLKSFNKRNKEKLELAAMLTEQRRRERETEHDQAPSRKMSSCSSHSSSMDSEQASSTRTGLEGRSMSLGAMTVMSYDIWKAKCAAEKKRLEAEGKATSPVFEEVQSHMRKRAHTFVAPGETKELPKVQPPHNKEKKGRYILLPTIPAMRIFVDEEMEKKMDHDVMDDTPVSSQPMENHMQEMKINSPIAVKPRVTAPTQMTVPAPVSVQHNFMKTTVPMSMPALPIPAMQAPMPSVSLHQSVQPHPISFPPATSVPTGVLSPEQLVILQNNILQQQNQALQQLLAMLPMNNPTPPTTTPSPDLFSLLKTQQLLQKDGLNQDLLQNLLQTRPQAIFSNSM